MDIPSEEDWQYDPGTLDEADAYRMFHGKTFDEAVRMFEVNAVWRREDLLYMPGRVFDFYVRAYIAYLMSDAARQDSEDGSGLISLIQFKAEHDPEALRMPWPAIEPALKHIVEHQDDDDAESLPYANFRVQVHEIVQRGFPVTFNTDVCEIVPRDVTIYTMSGVFGHHVSLPVAVQVFRNSGLSQINIDSRKADIQRILGPPDAEGGGVHPEYGPIPFWSRYDRPGHSLRFEFDEETIASVMFMPSMKSSGPPTATTPAADPHSCLDALMRFDHLFRRD